MARPSKPVDVNSKHLTKEEYKKRKAKEESLKGSSDKISPSEYLNDNQKKIFKLVVEEMKASGILSNLDIYLMDSFCVAVERLQYIDSLINNDHEIMFNRDVMAARKQHMDDFKKISTELGFSPQSRAKLGAINLKKEQDDVDPLLKAIKRVK